jgi:hypothetical protein
VALLLLACGGETSTSATPKRTPAPTPTPTPTASAGSDLLLLAAFLEGRYTGAWNNTTFGTTGPIAVDAKVDKTAGTVSVTLTLGGNVFGAPAPPPETFTIKPDPAQSTLTGRSTTFGDLSATFALAGSQGSFTMKGSNVPNPRVAGFEASATISDPRSFGGRYTVTFKDGTAPAQGTFTLTKAA